MGLNQILIFTLLTAALSAQRSHRVRRCGFFILSIVAIYWLQPLTTLRHFEFWLPTGTILFTVGGWVVTQPDSRSWTTEDRRTALALVGLVLLLGTTRFLPSELLVAGARPPRLASISLVLAGFTGLFVLFRFAARRSIAPAVLLGGVILLCFLVLQTDPITLWASRILRGWTSQDTALAGTSDLRWLGFSYLALRILHTLMDRLAGRLPGVSLQEYVIFTIFFPAITAGPIDRMERFVQDLRRNASLEASRTQYGGGRVLLGLVKKFVIADSLHLISLDAYNAKLVESTFWMWILLYAYAFEIYLDFSGYTDIALGIGILAGIELPENFKQPYLQPNIRMFWNGWHITLARWFRTYYFNPLTRRLRRLQRNPPQGAIVLLMQVSTMALIGLWHGVQWNFLLWGIWHGLGLFLHNRWTAFLRLHPHLQKNRWLSSKGATAFGIILMFHFVVLGWVLFELSDLTLIQQTYRVLFGMTGSLHAGG
jgi:alginate O-acetyltransferase complex protein AlgI